jgi:hypothetical protein
MITVGKFESGSPVVPEFEVPFLIESLPLDIAKNLSNLVLDKEYEILNISNNKDDPTWLTNRLGSYNLLNFDTKDTRIFNNFIYDQYKNYIKFFGGTIERVYVLCWANIVRFGGRTITPHHHANAHSDAPQECSYISGNFCAQVEGTNTYFKNPFLDKHISIPNNTAELVMFPSWMTHWADPAKTDIPRITISFDIITQDVYNLSNKKYYNLLETVDVN